MSDPFRQLRKEFDNLRGEGHPRITPEAIIIADNRMAENFRKEILKVTRAIQSSGRKPGTGPFEAMIDHPRCKKVWKILQEECGIWDVGFWDDYYADSFTERVISGVPAVVVCFTEGNPTDPEKVLEEANGVDFAISRHDGFTRIYPKEKPGSHQMKFDPKKGISIQALCQMTREERIKALGLENGLPEN